MEWTPSHETGSMYTVYTRSYPCGINGSVTNDGLWRLTQTVETPAAVLNLHKESHPFDEPEWMSAEEAMELVDRIVEWLAKIGEA